MRLRLSLLATCALAASACDGDDASVLRREAEVIGAGRPFYDPDRAAADAASAARGEDGELTGDASAAADAELAEDADPAVRFGWTRDADGYILLGFSDLGLEGYDKELLVEKLLYPEDYADEAIEWPARIRALDGEKVALTGYMIALLWEGTSVPQFMLVRDLMACCFGGSPQPDEWCDVTMQGEAAGYWGYVPVVTRGIFRLAGIADEAGYAAGAYSIEGHDVRREL